MGSRRQQSWMILSSCDTLCRAQIEAKLSSLIAYLVLYTIPLEHCLTAAVKNIGPDFYYSIGEFVGDICCHGAAVEGPDEK